MRNQLCDGEKVKLINIYDDYDDDDIQSAEGYAVGLLRIQHLN